LGDQVLAQFSVINTHPALLPRFPGAHAVADALAAGVAETGCTVHFVDEGVDTGPVIEQRSVSVEAGDDVESLHERIKVVERELLVQVVRQLCRSGWAIEGREVVSS
jgi:phosphoribosylglycinamide formyltransferase-1